MRRKPGHDCAAADECIGLMRMHLAEVGIEATFADDAAALAAAEIRKLREQVANRALPAEPPPGYVRARIAVVVDEHGVSEAENATNMSEMDRREQAAAMLSHYAQGVRHLVYLTVYAPLPPAPPEVVGTVEEARYA